MLIFKKIHNLNFLLKIKIAINFINKNNKKQILENKFVYLINNNNLIQNILNVLNKKLRLSVETIKRKYIYQTYNIIKINGYKELEWRFNGSNIVSTALISLCQY